MGTPQGLHGDSTRTPGGLHGDSMGTPQDFEGIIMTFEQVMQSSWGVHEDLWSPWGVHGNVWGTVKYSKQAKRPMCKWAVYEYHLHSFSMNKIKAWISHTISTKQGVWWQHLLVLSVVELTGMSIFSFQSSQGCITWFRVKHFCHFYDSIYQQKKELHHQNQSSQSEHYSLSDLGHLQFMVALWLIVFDKCSWA